MTRVPDRTTTTNANPRFTRRRLLAASGTAAILSRVPLSAQTPVATPAAGRIDQVRIAVSNMADLTDPLRNTTIESQWLSSLTYDSPLRCTPNGQIVDGLLSRSTTSADGGVIELTIRADARFADGSSLRAQDVQFTLERLRAAPGIRPYVWRLEHVRGIEVVDRRTVRLHLDQYDASLSASLSQALTGVVSAGAFDRMPRGTGPFEPMSMSQETAHFRRNPYFWEIGRPRISVLDVQVIPDDTARSTAITTDRVDLLPNVPLLDIPSLMQDNSVYLVGGPGTRTCMLHLNHRSTALRDDRVRRILSRAIDRDRLVQVATSSQALATSRLFAGTMWESDDVPGVSRLTPDEVRSGLQQIGIPSDLRLSLVADNADATLANTAIVLQEQLAACGIALEVDLLEGRQLEDAIRFRTYDLVAHYAAPWRDPHELVRPLLTSGGATNVFGYDNEWLGRLIDSGILQDDPAWRLRRYSRIERIVQEDVPLIVLFRPHYFDAISTHLPGYRQLPPPTSRGLLTVRTAEPERP